MMIDDKKIEELLSERASYSSRIARTWTEQFEDEDTGEIVNTERYEIESIEPTPEQHKRIEEIEHYLLEHREELSNKMLLDCFYKFDHQEYFDLLIQREDGEALRIRGNFYEDGGDEENGIYIDKQKALEYYKRSMAVGCETGKQCYDYLTKALEEPKIRNDGSGACNIEYHITGKPASRQAIINLIETIQTQLDGKNEPTEFGLYIPVSIITKTLVGSDAYEGNVMEYTANDDELMVRAIIDENSVEPLKYALLQSFDGLDISTVDLWEEDDDEMELPF